MANERKDGCLFCYPDQFPPTPQFAAWPGWAERGRTGNLAEVALFETDNLRVIPDALPVREDGQHVLLVGNTHRTAFAQPEDLGAETFYILNRLREESDGLVIFAEHGAGLPELGHVEQAKNQSIHHRHAHIIWGQDHGRDPLRYMQDELTHDGWAPRLVDVPDSPVSSLQKLYAGHPYLFFNVGNVGLWVEDVQGVMPSMVTQRKLSKFFGGEELSWKDIPGNPGLEAVATKRLMNLVTRCGGGGLFTPR